MGAGPSLEENIEWIKENQNKFIIVAMGASYGKLIRHGVTVDIITTLDSKLQDLSNGQFKLEDTQHIQNVNILASMNTAKGVLDRFNQEKLFLYEIIKNFKENAIVGNGMSIGEFTFRMLLELGVENLYLIGTDLALNQNTGAT